VVTGLTKNPDAVLKRVHDLGFPTCQLSIGIFDDATLAELRTAIAKYNVEVTSAIAVVRAPKSTTSTKDRKPSDWYRGNRARHASPASSRFGFREEGRHSWRPNALRVSAGKSE